MDEKVNATIRDVARVAEVSIATVSHVVNNSRPVKASTRHRVQEAIRVTGYRHNVVARELKMGSSGLIGVLIVDYNTFYMDGLRGIEDAVSDLEWEFVVASTGEDWGRQRELIEILVSRRMQGILIAPVEGFDPVYVSDYVPETIPIVQFDRHAGSFFPSVSSENFRGAQQLVEHLSGHGHRRIAFVTGVNRISSLFDRRRGVVETARRLGMEFVIEEGLASPEGGYAGAVRVLSSDEPPTAIVAGSNPILLGVLKAIRQSGLRIGTDIALVGFDDQAWCEVCDPPITVAHQSSYVMGRQAVAMLQGLIAGDRVESEVLKTELILRGSCGCPWHWT